MTKRWKPIADGAYSVSSTGLVRNNSTGRITAGWSKSGYRKTRVTINGQRRTVRIHRLVLETFVGPGNGMEPNHKDGVKSNNRLDNLEWLTHSENQKHAYAIGLQKRLSGKSNPMFGKKLSVEARRKIRTANLGRKRTIEDRDKQSHSLKSAYASGERVSYWKGKTMPAKIRLNMSTAQKRVWKQRRKDNGKN